MIRRAAAQLLLASTLASSVSAEPSGPRLLHVPPESKETELGVLTPVPVSLEVPLDLAARRVLLHYHVFGASEWRTLELRREGTRYIGAIPCLQVSEMTREIRYYIRIHDAASAVIAFSGTRANPYKVAIHHPSARPDLAGGVVHCPDPAECPPGLPGCPSEEVERIPCQRDADCEGALTCGWDNFCGEDLRRKNWFGVDVAQSIGVVATQGACSVASQESAGYACYRMRDAAVYTGRPIYSNEPLGVGLATTRVVVSYQRVLFYQTSLGLRAAYAFAGDGPTLPGATEFFPFSAELFARHWLGSDPFGTQGLRAFIGVGVGAGQQDIRFRMRVREDPLAVTYSQGGNDLEQTLRVWRRAGDAFVSLSAGVLHPLSASLGGELEISASQTFPYAATVLSASGGLRLGF